MRDMKHELCVLFCISYRNVRYFCFQEPLFLAPRQNCPIEIAGFRKA